MKRLALLILLLLQTSVVFAWTTYQTDQFHIHKLCIKDPWNVYNANPAYHTDVTSYPCQYDYAIVHVPTLLAEQANQIVTATTVIKLQIDPPDIDRFMEYFIAGFEFALIGLIGIWLLGSFFRHVIDLFRSARKR